MCVEAENEGGFWKLFCLEANDISGGTGGRRKLWSLVKLCQKFRSKFSYDCLHCVILKAL